MDNLSESQTLYYRSQPTGLLSVFRRALLWLLCSAWWSICSPLKWLANFHHPVSLLTTPLSIHGFDTHWCFSDFAHVIFSDWGLPLPTSSIATLDAPAEVEALFSWPVSYLIFQGPQIRQCEFPTHSQCDNYVSCHYHKQCFSSSLPCIEHRSYLS